MTVETGQFSIIRRSVARLSDDARIQAVLIGFAFGAFLEGAAGAGSPVAICGAMLVGLGFKPFEAAVLCLIANTSPVAYGGLGMPILTLHGVTGISGERISTMAGHQLPLMSCLVPFYMVKCMCGWRQTLQVWPALLVGGGSFAGFQFVFATFHDYVPGVVLYPMTDVGGGIFALVVTAVFLRFWRPKDSWHYHKTAANVAAGEGDRPHDAHEAAAKASVEALLGSESGTDLPLTAWRVIRAWSPFAIMSLMLMLTGLLRQRESELKSAIPIAGPIKSYYMISIPELDQQVAGPSVCKRTQKAISPKAPSSN